MGLPGRQGEVDEGDLGGYLWGVVGVGQFGGDVEAEVLVVGNHSISQSDHQRALLLERLTQTNKQENK